MIVLLLILLVIALGAYLVLTAPAEGYRNRRVWWCPVRQKWVSTPIWMGVE